MTIKQQGGIFGRNPTFNDVSVENSLTVTGDLNVDSNTFFVESSTNRVGINTNEPSQELEVNGTIRVILDVSDYAFGITTSGPAGFFIEPDDYQAANPTWKIRTNANENISMFRGNSDCGTFTANGLAFPNGKGIDFSATSGTGTSELFSDYEEGSFSPTLTVIGTDFDSVTYDTLTGGYYTKVGNLVVATGRLRTDAVTVGSASGIVAIGGLPFTVGGGANGRSALLIGEADDFSTNNPSGGRVNDNSTTARLFYRSSANGAATNLPVSSIDTGSNKNQVSFTAIYRV